MMFEINLFKLRRDTIILLFISFSLIFLKWYFAFVVHSVEDINLKIINEINDNLYLPLIYSFSNFDFAPSFNQLNDNLGLISFPILGLSIHSLFYKIFGGYGFIVIQFLSVFFFLYIFYKSFRLMKVTRLTSIFYATFLFSVTSIVNDLAASGLPYFELINNNFYNFYNLRIPRALTTNLLMFAFLFFSHKIFINKEITLNNYILTSLLIGLTLHSFFYFFLFQLTLIFILYLVNFKKNFFSFIVSNKKIHIVSSLIISFFFIVFIVQQYYSEVDYGIRIGVTNINLDEKIILLTYLLKFFINIFFLLLLFINIFLFIYFKERKHLFFYFFVSTVLTTCVFFLFTNKIIDPYHFINWIIISGILNIIINFFIHIDTSFFKTSNTNNFSKQIVIVLTFIVIIYFNFSLNKNHIFKEYQSENRDNQIELTNFIKDEKFFKEKKLEILTFDKNIFSWLLFYKFENFTITPVSFWVSKKNIQIERELINIFKFFDLSNEDFINFLANTKSGYRFKNSNVEDFFDRKYLANSLKTYKNSNDFSSEINNYIKNTSLLITHQLIIPNFEFDRFSKNHDKIHNKIKPEIIILHKKKNNFFLKNDNIKNNYCLAFENDYFQMFYFEPKIKCTN